ncbi:hypothetical protein P7K49_011528, partial [Saguinus oedipus]
MVHRPEPPLALRWRQRRCALPPRRPRPRPRCSALCPGMRAHSPGARPPAGGAHAAAATASLPPSLRALLPFPPLRPLPRRQPARQSARTASFPAPSAPTGSLPRPPGSPGRSPLAVARARWMWLAAAAPSLARRLLFLGPPPPPLLLLLLSRSSRRRRRLHSLGLAAMPEKRPFERLPADVSPINYSLCLKPDLLDFTFEGKLEAAAQ